MRKYIPALILLTFFGNCYAPKLNFRDQSSETITGEAFYNAVLSKTREEREKIAAQEILSGNIPDFLKKFTPVKFDTVIEGKNFRVKLYVLPDYLSIGTEENFARIPLTPMTAQLLADSFNCFLPTRKIVDLVYRAAKIKLEPVPMYAFRDSSVTMYQHSLIIEGQRRLRKGLIAGIKKDVVITTQLKSKPGKVAIYGWHRINGKAIQPLYTGHVNWYVDYSHGIRLVYQTIYINGHAFNYRQVLTDPLMKRLICDEDDCDCFGYGE